MRSNATIGGHNASARVAFPVLTLGAVVMGQLNILLIEWVVLNMQIQVCISRDRKLPVPQHIKYF